MKTKQITISVKAHSVLTQIKEAYCKEVGRKASYSEAIENMKLKKK